MPPLHEVVPLLLMRTPRYGTEVSKGCLNNMQNRCRTKIGVASGDEGVVKDEGR